MLNKSRKVLKHRIKRSKAHGPVPTLQDINKVLYKVGDKQDRLTDRQIQWDNRHAEINDAIARIGEQLGGVTNNLGKINEAFFRHVLANERPVMIGKVPFNIILADQTYEANDKAMQLRSSPGEYEVYCDH